MRCLPAALLTLWVSVGSATAQTVGEIKWALGEVAGELQVCSVYFGVISRCIKHQRPDLGITYRDASNKLADLAISSGRAVGVSDEAFIAQAASTAWR